MSNLLFIEALERLRNELKPVRQYWYMGKSEWRQICAAMGLDVGAVERDGRLLRATIAGLSVTVFPVDAFGPIVSEYDWCRPMMERASAAPNGRY